MGMRQVDDGLAARSFERNQYPLTQMLKQILRSGGNDCKTRTRAVRQRQNKQAAQRRKPLQPSPSTSEVEARPAERIEDNGDAMGANKGHGKHLERQILCFFTTASHRSRRKIIVITPHSTDLHV